MGQAIGERRFYSVGEYAQVTGLSEATTKRHLRARLIPFVRQGRRILIPCEYVERLRDDALATVRGAGDRPNAA